MRLWRYCLASLTYDLLFFMAWHAIPALALRRGASSSQLGLLQTTSSVAYVAVCLWAGRLADRVPKPRLMTIGCAGILAWCVGLALSGSLNALYALVAFGGIAGAIFWPAIQGALGAETPPERMDRALGLFNVTWSAGKAAGFFAAGAISAWMEPSTTLWIAAALAFPTWLLLPRDERPAVRDPAHPRGEERAVFRTLGYVANFAAFGVGSAFQIQFLKYLKEAGPGSRLGPETFFGIFLGSVFAAQTVSFWLLQRGEAWAYRRGLLYASQAVLAAGVLGVAAAPSDLLILALTPVVGAGLGFSYASSIYYSLHGPADHGRYAGLHEAVLGAGTVLVPLLGGALADATGELRAPYWLAALLVLAAVPAEQAIYRRNSRS
jgi:MFS family permease